jgi:hypothetical protein
LQSETDSTCRSQNLAFDDFKATSPMKSKMNLCLLDVPKSNTDSHAKRKRISIEFAIKHRKRNDSPALCGRNQISHFV